MMNVNNDLSYQNLLGRTMIKCWNASQNLTANLLKNRAVSHHLEKNQPAISATMIEPEIIDTIEIRIKNHWSFVLLHRQTFIGFMANLITSTSDSTLSSLAAISPNPVAFSEVE